MKKLIAIAVALIGMPLFSADQELRLIDASCGAPVEVFMQAAMDWAMQNEKNALSMQKMLPGAALKALKEAKADAVIIERRFVPELPQIPWAAEALALYVSNANPVTQLSRRQVQEILFAPHPNWLKYNQQHLDIQRIAIKISSADGTLMHRIFGNKIFDDRIFKVESFSAGFAFTNPATIFFARFVPLPPLEVKFVYIDGVPPSSAGIIKGEYPLSMHYVVAWRQKSAELSGFLKFLNQHKYRTVMKNSGLIVLLPAAYPGGENEKKP